MRRALLIVLAALVVATAPAAAQVIGGRWEQWAAGYGGDRWHEEYGRSVLGIGDADGDGFADFLVGSPRSDTNTVDSGSLTLYSGRTGLPVWSDPGAVNANEHFAAALARIEDVDGDSVDDFLVGATHHEVTQTSTRDVGAIYLYSGRSRALLARIYGGILNGHLGFSVADAGDVDGDGVHDLLAGAPDADHSTFPQAGSARLHSGATFQLLREWRGAAAAERLGWSVAGVGDWDRDGFDDVLLGAPFALASGHPEAGRVEIRSGSTGALLGTIEGDAPGAHFGHALAAVGDLDGDGRREVLIGAPEADPGGLADAGSVFLYAPGAGLVRRYDGGAAWERLGSALSGAGDVDRDGFEDHLLGAPGASSGGAAFAGAVHLRSGRAGTLIHSQFGDFAGEQLGFSVARADDVSGDGLPDCIAGAPFSAPPFHGRGVVHALDPFLTISEGTLSAAAGGAVGLDLRFPQDFAAGAYLVVASAHGPGATAAGGLTIPLARDALFERTLGGWHPAGTVGFAGVLSAQAEAGALLLAAPGDLPPAWIGRTLTLAAIARSPGSGALVSSVFRTLAFTP